MNQSDLDKIAELTGANTVKPATALCCEACVHTYPFTGTVPQVCPKCGTAARQWPGKDEADAKTKAAGGARLRSAVPPVPPPEAPKAPETKQPEEPKPPEAPKEKTKRTRKAAETKTEAAPVAEATKRDWEAEREAFKLAHKLNEVNWTQVGTGIVSTTGFTVWIDQGTKRVPAYRFMESWDTPESFRALYDIYQKQYPGVRADALKVSGLSDGLASAAFQGEVVATSNLGSGTVRIPIGAKVNLFAKVAKTGSIIWGAGLAPAPLA